MFTSLTFPENGPWKRMISPERGGKKKSREVSKDVQSVNAFVITGVRYTGVYVDIHFTISNFGKAEEYRSLYRIRHYKVNPYTWIMLTSILPLVILVWLKNIVRYIEDFIINGIAIIGIPLLGLVGYAWSSMFVLCHFKKQIDYSITGIRWL